MPKLIMYGLGNNDPKYFNTKHNVGRILLEKIVNAQGLEFTQKNNFNFCRLENIYFIYSSGFMNESGLPLANFVNYFKLTDFNLLIFQDDSDQQSGKIKLLQGGGSAGHHGINSIYKHFGPRKLEFWRLKLGIRPVNNHLKSENFVLSLVTQEDLFNYSKIQEIIIQEILSKADFNIAQNKINGL